MDTCKRKIVWIYFIINLSTAFGFIISSQNAQISDPTTVKPYETTPLSELIQQQTDAIKKILSSNQDINFNKHSTNNCEEIESSIKETLTRSQVAQNAHIFEPQPHPTTQIQKQVNVEIVTTEINEPTEITTEIAQTILPELKPAQPSGRTLFSMFKSAEIDEPTSHQTLNAVKLNDNQNYILIPCLKRVVHNRTTESVAQNAQTFELQQPQTVQVPPPSLVLEKVHAPNGEFLYYRYKTPATSNTVEVTQNVEQFETQKVEKPQIKRVNTPSTEFVNYRYKTADTLNNEEITPNFEHLQTPAFEPSDKIKSPASDLLYHYKTPGNSNAVAEITQNSELPETQTPLENHAPSGEYMYYRYKTPGLANNNGITQNSEQSEPSQISEQPNVQTAQAPPSSLTLEKVLSPSGEFMYYRYKTLGVSNNNGITQNLEQPDVQTAQAQPPSLTLEKVLSPSGEFMYYRYKTPGVSNNNGVTQNFEQPDVQTAQAPPPSLVLEKVLSPNGEFMYYRYKTPGVSNNNGITQNVEQVPPPSLTLEKVHSPSGEFLYYRYKTAGILNNNEQIIENSEQFETQTAQTPPSSLVLEKVYAPSGEFMYYIYRYKSAANVEPVTSSTTERSQEPVYTEQMRFIVQMPYADPEQAANYPWQFDKYAYYPKNIQPTHVNTPVEYKPVFHMIRTLAIPGEYPASVLNEAQDTQNGGYVNQNGGFETKN